MSTEKQCWTCIFGMNTTGEVTCHNRTVNKLRRKASKPDPYDCEWYEEISDDYAADMEKVMGEIWL